MLLSDWSVLVCCALIGPYLNPLDNVELLLGVDEGLEEEAGGEPGGHDGDVVPHTIALLVERRGKVLDLIINNV